jgi:hypothetical protein
VAIPLRENVPIFSVNPILLISGIRLESRPRSQPFKAPAKDFKLLKFLILRVAMQLLKLYHESVCLEPPEIVESTE